MRKITCIFLLFISMGMLIAFPTCLAETNATINSATANIELSISHNDHNGTLEKQASISDIIIPVDFSTHQKCNFVKTFLHNAGMDADFIETVPESILIELASAETIIMGSIIWGDDYDSGTIEYENITIYSVLANFGETTIRNGVTHNVYSAFIAAQWTDMPIMRLTDMFVLTTSINAYYGASDQNLGYAQFTYHNRLLQSYTEEYTMDNTADSVMREYSMDGYIGAKINLPNDDHLIVNGKYYDEGTIMITCPIEAPADQPFHMYTAYGHLTVGLSGAEVVISPSPGVGISFGSNTTTYTGEAVGSHRS